MSSYREVGGGTWSCREEGTKKGEGRREQEVHATVNGLHSENY